MNWKLLSKSVVKTNLTYRSKCRKAGYYCIYLLLYVILFRFGTLQVCEPPWSSGSVLDHRSLPPVFESRRGDIWRLFRLWLRLIAFGRHSAHLAYRIDKSGRKTSILITIIGVSESHPPGVDLREEKHQWQTLDSILAERLLIWQFVPKLGKEDHLFSVIIYLLFFKFLIQQVRCQTSWLKP